MVRLSEIEQKKKWKLAHGWGATLYAKFIGFVTLFAGIVLGSLIFSLHSNDTHVDPEAAWLVTAFIFAFVGIMH